MDNTKVYTVEMIVNHEQQRKTESKPDKAFDTALRSAMRFALMPDSKRSIIMNA